MDYGDPFATLGSANWFAVFDNIRGVELVAPPTQPQITGINVVGSTIDITFTAGANGTPAAFKLQGSRPVPSGFAEDNSADHRHRHRAVQSPDFHGRRGALLSDSPVSTAPLREDMR